MNVATEGDHHKDLTGTGTSTVSRSEHLMADCTQSRRVVRKSLRVPVVYLFDGFGDGTSVGVVVKVELDVSLIAKCHHTYLYLVWSDLELANDVD